MNNSKSALQANARFVPPDSLLKFGFSPNGSIEFDSAAALLSFSFAGTPKADIGAFGVAVREGEGLIVGHSAQVVTGGASSTPEFQILGTGVDDSRGLLARFSADGSGPQLQFVKSRDPAIADGTFAIVVDDDAIMQITAQPDDGTDFQYLGGLIEFTVDDASPTANAVGTDFKVHTATTGGTLTEALRIDSSQNIGLPATSKLFFDGMCDTYIYEESADDLHVVVGGAIYLQVDQDLNAMSLGNAVALADRHHIKIGGDFTSGGGGTDVAGVHFEGEITGASGDTARILGTRFVNTFVTQTATESIAHIAQVAVGGPAVTDNLTGDITRASTLWIAGVPTAGETNNGIYMPAGAFEVSDGQGASGEQLASGGADGNLSWTASSSVRESKQDISERFNDDEVLATIIETPVHDFKYRQTEFETTTITEKIKDKKTGKITTHSYDVSQPVKGKRYTSTGDYDTDYVGIIADEAPWAMHHNGRILNPINTFGYTVQGFKALERRIKELEIHLEATE